MQPSCTGKLLAAQLVLGVFVVLVLVAVGINRPVLPAGTIEQSHSRLSDEPSSSFEAAETYRLLREETGSVLDTSQATPDADSPFRGDTSCSRGAVPPSQAPKQHQKGVYIRAHRYGDLSALRQDRNPWDPAWDNGIAICACMFQENTTDVREWLLYHKWLGVDHIYLTANVEPAPEGTLPALQEFIDEGFLTFNTAAKPWFQQTIYFECMQQHRHKHNWMAFIDLDEFIVLRKKDVTLNEFLDGYKHESGLVMHWVIMGASGRDTRPPEGGVLRSYRRCQPTPASVVKSITNTYKLANMVASPHTFEYRKNRASVDEHRIPMPWRYDLPPACTDGTVSQPDRELDCRPVPHVQKRPATADSIAVFHYVTKSKEDFALKAKRGGGGGSHRTWQYFERIQEGASSKGGLCDEAFKVADDCCDPKKYTAATPKKAAKQHKKTHSS